MSKKFAEEFTNLYSLSKTLRFELKPEKETKEIIERELENFKDDKKIAENYKELKKLLDELHQEFIQDAMNNFKFDSEELREFEEKYLESLNFKDKDNFQKKQQLKNAYTKVGEKLAKKVASAFSKYKADKYENKFTLKNILDKSVLDILKEKHKGDEEKIKVIETFDGLFTYLTGFKQNRENFYKAEIKSGKLKSGQFAARTIDNLVQFIKNKKVFDDKYKDNHKQIGITDKQVKIFDLEYFNNLFLQDGIDKYNGTLGNKKGEVNVTNDGINQKINNYRQKLNKSERKKYILFKELYKQIGSIKKDNDVYIEILNDEHLVGELNAFPEKVERNVSEVEKFYQTFFEKLQNDEFDLEKIYLPKSVGTYLSQLVFSDWSKLSWVYNKKWKLQKEGKEKELEKLEKYIQKKEKEGKPVDVNEQYRSLADIKKRIEEVLEQDEDGLTFGRTCRKVLNLPEEVENVDEAWQIFWQIIEYHIDAQFAGGARTVFDKEKDGTVDEELFDLEVLKKNHLEATKLYKQKMVDSEEGLSDKEEKEIKEKIKEYLDRVKEIERIAHYFDLRKDFEDIDEADKDSDFYYGNNKEIGYQELLDGIVEAKINAFYNEFRNYLTKSNVKDEKIKLNFDSGSLLSGWDINMETQKLGLIFRKQDKTIGWRYYLGIINKKKDGDIFDKQKHIEIFTNGSNLEKLEYKQISDVSKDIQNLMIIDGKTVRRIGSKKDEGIRKFFAKEGVPKDVVVSIKSENKVLEYLKDKHLPEEINRIRKTKSYSISSENFSKDDLIQFIDFYKERIAEYQEGIFEFKFKDSSEYKSFKDFTDHISQQDYYIKFIGVNEDYLDEKVANGELYLFEIHNKDWNLTEEGGAKKQSKKNLHTIYFEELFSDENIEETVFKLSGGAEVFLRPAIEKKKWKKKKDKTGKEILDKLRFTKNKILFHVPITINYGKPNINQGQFNAQINEFVAKNNSNIKVIGIDRGEKHLLYYSLINSKGEIEDSSSLNVVDEYGHWLDDEELKILEEYDVEIESAGGERERVKRWKYKKGGKEIKAINFHAKLDELERKRQKARKSWQKIDQIKNLKAGYISHVIKKIVDLAIEHNAIIVLEDLNFGFKSFRQKIEKNVYQQFEKALIDKLGFVVDKEKPNHRHAPQLSAPFESFEKMGKQTGIVYYVLAANTSKVCPSCQWRKNIYPHYKGKNTISEVLQKEYKMKMFWDDERKRFEFEYKGKDDNDFVKIYSDVDRVRYDKKLNNNSGGYHIYNNDNNEKKEVERNIEEKSLTNLLLELLQTEFGIENLGGDLLLEINKKTEGVKSECIKDFIGLLNSVLNIRNSVSGTNQDYIQCPVCGFDTRKENKLGIKNGDDNGAYNIALRGLFLVNRIKKADKEKKKPKLAFRNNDYFQWVKEFKK